MAGACLAAALLIGRLGDASAAPETSRPYPSGTALLRVGQALLRPPFSPHAFIETRAGTIQVALDMIDAPLTSLTFIELARSGFFDGIGSTGRARTS